MFFQRKADEMVTAENALAGRDAAIATADVHFVNGGRCRVIYRRAWRRRCSGWDVSGVLSGCSGGWKVSG